MGTADTELEIQGLLQLDDPKQKLITGGANLDLKDGVSISAGEISSTGGTVSIEKSVNLNGGTISISSYFLKRDVIENPSVQLALKSINSNDFVTDKIILLCTTMRNYTSQSYSFPDIFYYFLISYKINT